MKIVVDTNVVISGIFFGGNPRKIVEYVVDGKIEAIATKEIIEEYMEIVDYMVEKKQGKLDHSMLSPLYSSMRLIEAETSVDVCRDPDDNKFIECAVDAKALYIVSGDKDLLDVGKYGDVKIVTAKEFCDQYLRD